MAETAPGTTSDTATTAPIAVVRRFLDALRRDDVDAAADLLAPDAIWHNVPFPPARGRDTIVRQLRGMERYDLAFDVEMHNIAANGPVVLTERTDRITRGPVGGEFWVCGTFEVHDGRITVWRDRFDFVDVLAGTVRWTAQGLWNAVRG
jgi:limonene-1,2-epoxide hydrolase